MKIIPHLYVYIFYLITQIACSTFKNLSNFLNISVIIIKNNNKDKITISQFVYSLNDWYGPGKVNLLSYGWTKLCDNYKFCLYNHKGSISYMSIFIFYQTGKLRPPIHTQFDLPIDLQVELTDWRVSYRPNDWPDVSFAFQSSTVQAKREAKLCVYGGPK
jgi:hypothetical protein